ALGQDGRGRTRACDRAIQAGARAFRNAGDIRHLARGGDTMCGIAGHVPNDTGRDGKDARQLARTMTYMLRHRGPDALAVHQSGRVVLGHARLSIIDLSTDANQPMLSADGQVVLVFNGEIYNFRELALELRDAGVTLRTRSDTEVLLELYRLHGTSFVSKLRGMFAFAIWDAPRRRLVLGRDRLG